MRKLTALNNDLQFWVFGGFVSMDKPDLKPRGHFFYAPFNFRQQFVSGKCKDQSKGKEGRIYMRLKKIQKLTLILIGLLLSACGVGSSTTAVDKYAAALRALQPSGVLELRKAGYASANYCYMDFVFINNHQKLPVEPRIKVIFYDATDNTLATSSVFFDPILAQKTQSKRDLVSANCDRIARGYLSESSGDSGSEQVEN